MVPQFSDTSNNKSWFLWCTCPNKSLRDLWPLRDVPTHRPSEPFCNTSYHVRGTFGVFHRNGMLQFSVSHLSSDSAWGCSISVKKTQVALQLDWALDNFPPVLQAGCLAQPSRLPQVKRCLAAHPMRAEDIPLKRHTDTCRGIAIYNAHPFKCQLKRHSDTCRGIATYITIPFTIPTQEAFWHLPWNCCWSFL